MDIETVKDLACARYVYAAAFTSDGNLLATGDISGTLTFWDIVTGKPERFVKKKGQPRSIGISKHNHVMAVGTVFDGKIEIWNTQTKKVVKIFSGFEQEVVSVSLDDAGRYVAGCTLYGQLMVWDVQKKRRVFAYPRGSQNVQAVALSSDGTLLAAVVGPHVVLWETLHWEVVHKINHGTDYFHSIAFSPDGRMLTCMHGLTDLALLVFQCPSWKTLFALRGHSKAAKLLCFSHDSKILASADSRINGGTRLWDAKTGALRSTILEPGKVHTALAFHPTQNLLAVANEDGTITISRLNG